MAPRDHVRLRYVRPARDGSRAGPGAQLRIQELFDRRPEYAIDVVATVLRLDRGGFSHVEHVGGVAVARMDYTFEEVPGGTRYVNSLTVGLDVPVVGSPFNRWVRPSVFSMAKGEAWQKHNVEEVGNLENFLPALWEEHRGG